MTKHFRDRDGRQWKAWLATRDVFWPEPEPKSKKAKSLKKRELDQDYESVIFVCFSDPRQPQRRAKLPSGAFDALSSEDLESEFMTAVPDPVL